MWETDDIGLIVVVEVKRCVKRSNILELKLWERLKNLGSEFYFKWFVFDEMKEKKEGKIECEYINERVRILISVR